MIDFGTVGGEIRSYVDKSEVHDGDEVGIPLPQYQRWVDYLRQSELYPDALEAMEMLLPHPSQKGATQVIAGQESLNSILSMEPFCSA